MAIDSHRVAEHPEQSALAEQVNFGDRSAGNAANVSAEVAVIQAGEAPQLALPQIRLQAGG